MISNNVIDSNFIAVLNSDTQLGFVTNGTVTSGSADVLVSSTVGITLGAPISGLPGNLFGFPVGTTVSSIGTNSFVASVSATSNYVNEIYFANGEMRYQTLGSAPNRTLVVQWLRERKFGSGIGVDECFNYQLHLCETSNEISVVYGDCLNGTTVGTYEVGLRGGNFFDFNNCDNFNGWLNTVPGVNSFDFCALDFGYEPPSGLTFRWNTTTSATIPVITASSPGGTVVCSTSASTLTASGANTYSWSNGSVGATINPVISANTIYTVTGTANNGCIAYAQLSMSVIAGPTVTTSGTSSICSGSSGSITSSGATTYSWSNSATGSSVTVSPLANTTYTVYGTDVVSGCTSQAIHNMLVYALPTVSVSASSGTLCAAQSATVSASGANTYSWNTGATSSSISVSSAGTYTVYGTNVAGCTSSITQSIVASTPFVVILTASSSTLCVGQTVTLTANGAATYSWNTSATGSVITDSPITNTTYTATGTSSEGCSQIASYSVNVSPCTGVESYSSLSGVNAYPNPTWGEFTITFNTYSEKTIEVLDMTGRIIFSETTNEGKIRLNLGQFSNGVYFVKIQSNDLMEIIKVVKQ
jgi:hypothetical protein